MERMISESEIEARRNSEKVHSLIEGLIELADFLQKTPEIHQFIEVYSGGTTTIDLDSWVDGENFKRAAKSLGSFTKQFDDYYFNLEKYFGEGTVMLRIRTGRSNVCERKVVGKETVEEPAREARKYEREIVEYSCPESLLAD